MTEVDNTARVPTTRQRVAAGLALVTGVATIAFLATQAIRRWDVLLATIVSMAVLVAAGWIVLSRTGARRAIAAAIGVAALAVFIVVMVASESIPVLVIALTLAIITVAATGGALLDDEPEPAPEPRRAAPAKHPVLIMNLKSGGGKAERFALDERCRERGIEPVVLTPESDLLQLAEDAVAGGADVLGMAGGDGSQALVASVASRHGLPFVVVPSGTRNHFALDLGIDRDNVVGALDAFSEGVVRVVDLADVNGRVFVNNASMGVYARIVQSDEYRDAKVQTTAAMLPEMLQPNATPLDLRFNLPSGDEATTAQLVLVSNNPYQLGGLRGAFTRQSMNSGRLGVVSLMVAGLTDAQKLTALQAVGQGHRYSGLDEWTAAEFEVRSSDSIEIGVDGESLSLEPPLKFRIRRSALTVHLPPSATIGTRTKNAVRISSRDTVMALWRTALGYSVAP